VTDIEQSAIADAQARRDAQALAGFGYPQELNRSLSFWTNWAVGFAFISPVVGLYTIIGFGTMTAGPPWIWTLPVVLLGQILVVLVFGELAAEFPIAGGIYQWTRRLVGPTFAWFAGWGYLWTLMLLLTANVFFGGQFLAALFGATPGTDEKILWALAILAFTTTVNAVGLSPLKYVVNAGITAELIASVTVGLLLVLFFRKHSPSSLFDTFATGDAFKQSPLAGGIGSYGAAFFASMAFTGWAFVGFDACGTISEETRDPTRRVPRAMLLSLVLVAAVIFVSAVGIELAIPSQRSVVSGSVADPVIVAVTTAFGAGLEKPFLAVVVVAFLAAGITVQATAARVAFSFARDGMLPASRVIRRVSRRNRVPFAATLVTGVIASLGLFFSKAQPTLIAFGAGGYYIAFFLVCAAALYARLNGRWKPSGTFRLGRFGTPVNVAAVVWLAVEGLNIAWPRLKNVAWYERWATPFVAACLFVVGVLYVCVTRPQRRAAQSTALGDLGHPELTATASQPNVQEARSA
jgi:amino acid transporter